MPDLTVQTQSNFQFSAANVADLEGASEYTLVTIAVDISASVHGFHNELERCIQTIVESCKKSPRSDNLMIRILTFNREVKEMHGFKLLEDIDVDSYQGSLVPSGSTSCYDAIVQGIEAINEYARLLRDQEFLANGVFYVLTDGADNNSSYSRNEIKNRVGDCIRDEYLESLSVILIGVGYDNISSYLDELKDEAELNQFVSLTDLFNESNPESALAKLAGYVSQSIVSSSQSLANGSTGTAGASSSLLII